MGKGKKGMDDYRDEILDYVETLNETDQLVFVSNLVSGLVMSGKMSHIERLGILECARVDVVNNIINPAINEEFDRLTNSN